MASLIFMGAVKSVKLASFLLRAGLGIVFLYAAIASLLDPESWIGFLPAVARKVIDPGFLLKLFSAYEILLALWLMSGKETFHAALLSAATLFGIIVQNIGLLDNLFRDVAILFAALALAVLSAQDRKSEAQNPNLK